jgi:two-component system NtrC family response regulator
VEFFLGMLASSMEEVPLMTPEGMVALQEYAWPGNIRELRNVIERSATMCTGRITGAYLRRELDVGGGGFGVSEGGGVGVPGVFNLPTESESGEPVVPLREAKDQLVSDFERQYLERLLRKHKMNISASAREAQVDRRHFYRLLKKYDLMK